MARSGHGVHAEALSPGGVPRVRESLAAAGRRRGADRGSSIVMRFCPECAHTDFVVAKHCDVELWLWRDERIAAWMAVAADVMAEELALAGSLRSAQSPHPR